LIVKHRCILVALHRSPMDRFVPVVHIDSTALPLRELTLLLGEPSFVRHAFVAHEASMPTAAHRR
jgi:hypothetical protein